MAETKRKRRVVTVRDLLAADAVKGILDEVESKIASIDGILIIYHIKNGGELWLSSADADTVIAMLERMKFDILSLKGEL
jgi:hypothetical protein